MSLRNAPGLPVALATLAIALVGVAAVEYSERRALRAAERASMRAALETLAPAAAVLLAKTSAVADAEVRGWAEVSGLRVTLIAPDGRVHADSWTLPELLGRLENHLARPEVASARRGDVTFAERRSATTDHPTTYTARLLGPAEAPVGYLRLARERGGRPWPWVGLLVALLMAATAGRVAYALAIRQQRAAARHLRPWTELPASADLAALAEEADRTFRTTRERLARESDATRAALAEVSEGVILLDRDGVVRFANPAAAALLGGELVVGHPLVEAARAPELLAALRAATSGAGVQHTTVPMPGEGELVVRVCALDHPMLAAAAVLHDTRAEKQLERARRALVADLAHELRTPLTVLSGLAEELEGSASPPEALESLRRQVRRLTVFSDELGELAAIEAGQVRLRAEEADATAIARQVVTDLAAKAAAAEVALRVEGDPAPLRIDPVRLAQVLTNLVENAVRYNRRGGFVAVRSAACAEGVEVVVEDDGIGIPASEVGLVFQRFYRVRRGPEREHGSGLGLAIVKHLVRALRGTVSLTSREGAGTRVTLVFPIS